LKRDTWVEMVGNEAKFDVKSSQEQDIARTKMVIFAEYPRRVQ